MELFLATENTHKRDELKEILKGHTILLPSEKGISFSCEETGTTYFENAYLKAKTLYDTVRRPVLADDSGLSVAALDGAPGIYSARYGSTEEGVKRTDRERNEYLLNTLKKQPGQPQKQAFFVACLVLICGDYRFFCVQETVEGEITHTPRGENGFGYDPVFYLPSYGKTTAELSPEEKNRISHRGKAGKKIKLILDDPDKA